MVVTIEKAEVTVWNDKVNGTVESKAKHRIALACNGSNRSEETPHFLLREYENLRRPPRAQLPPLRRINGRI